MYSVSIGKPQQSVPGVNAVEKASALKHDLLEAIERLGDRLPPNTLDQLIDELGGPDCVAEVCYLSQCFVLFCLCLLGVSEHKILETQYPSVISDTSKNCLYECAHF